MSENKNSELSSIENLLPESVKGVAGKFLDYFKNTVPSFMKAFEKASKDKDAGFFEKIGIFFSSFWDEMHKIESAEKDLTTETEQKISNALDGEQLTVETGSTTVTDKEAETLGDQLDTSVSKTFSKALDEVDGDKTEAKEAAKKVKKALEEKKPANLSLKETERVAAASLMTITALKDKFSNPEEFRKQLDILTKRAGTKKNILNGIFYIPVLTLFHTDVGIGDLGEVKRLLDELGIKATDAVSFKSTLSLLKSDMSSDQIDQAAAMFQEVFPNTGKENVRQVVRILNDMLVNSRKKLNTQTLTDLFFSISDDDYNNLITILAGHKTSRLALAV